MPRPPKVWYSDRERCWLTTVGGEVSEVSGRRKPLRNREIGPPAGRDGARNRAAAELWLAALVTEEADAERRGRSPSFADLAEMYCDWSARHRKARTVQGHAERLRAFGRFEAGGRRYADVPAAELRPTDLARFLAHARREGYGPTYVASITLSVMACLNWAARPVADRQPERILAANPFEGVERPRVPAPPRRYVGAEARRAFLTHARRRSRRAPRGSGTRRSDRLACLLFVLCEETGCRPSEACRLEWSHVRWDESRVVAESWSGRRARAEGKTAEATGRPRAIPLTGRALRVLRAIDRAPGRHERFVFTHGHAPGSGDAGVPWTGNALAHKFRQWRDEAIAAGAPIATEGPAALTLYSFRRDLGADVLRGGGSYADVAEVLGNSAAVAERHYASFASAHAVDLARKVAEARRRGPGGA